MCPQKTPQGHLQKKRREKLSTRPRPQRPQINADVALQRPRQLVARNTSHSSAICDVRFGSKADMCSAQADVRFVPIADIGGQSTRADRGCQGHRKFDAPLPGGPRPRYLAPLLLIVHFCVQLLIQELTEPIPCVLHGPVLQNSSHDFFCASAGNEPNAKLITTATTIVLSMFLSLH